MKATGRADLAANGKVLDIYTSNVQLEDQLHHVHNELQDAKSIAEKVCMNSMQSETLRQHEFGGWSSFLF